MNYNRLKSLDIKSFKEHFMYYEIPPDKNISEYVLYYWNLKAKNSFKTELEYKVLPNYYIDLVFDYTNKKIVIMGLINKMDIIMLNDEIDLLGIRFLPKAIPFIFKGNAKNTLNRIFYLEDIPKELALIKDKIFSLENSEASNLINCELNKYLKNYYINDKL
ncbi:MAG: hypothetical protein JW924_04910 [Fusobacteriaceae bacterium]|nr:hypothetical protein [Fusobacteriaceae bacterium]